MNDTSPAMETLLTARFAAMTGAERLLMALQMFETAQKIVLSSLSPGLDETGRRRELVRRFYGDELAQRAFPAGGVAATARTPAGYPTVNTSPFLPDGKSPGAQHTAPTD